MKLKYFNQQTAPARSRSEAVIAVTKKSGLIRISKPACELMKLKAGSIISFAQDTEKPESWYAVPKAVKGFVLSENKKLTGGLFFNNKTFALELLGSIKGADNVETVKILVRSQWMQYEKQVIWPLDLSLVKK